MKSMGRTDADVDFRTSTIGGLLKQIRKANFYEVDENSPGLVEVWVCTIVPKYTKSILRFVQNHVDHEEQERLHHLKRFKKHGEGSNTRIVAILCTARYMEYEHLLSLLEDESGVIIEGDSLKILSVPKEIPLTKEISQKWSDSIWPMAWKGNPNHQALLTAGLDLVQEKLVVKALFDELKSEHPFVTIVAEKQSSNGQIKILHTAIDERNDHPLRHSIMNAISMVALEEKSRRENLTNERNGYLCQNLLFYTSFEPCAMCAMALVHSRIERLVYLNKHKRGAIESSYFIGDRRDLNWTFDIWRWVGENDYLPFEDVSHLDP